MHGFYTLLVLGIIIVGQGFSVPIVGAAPSATAHRAKGGETGNFSPSDLIKEQKDFLKKACPACKTDAAKLRVAIKVYQKIISDIESEFDSQDKFDQEYERISKKWYTVSTDDQDDQSVAGKVFSLEVGIRVDNEVIATSKKTIAKFQNRSDLSSIGSGELNLARKTLPSEIAKLKKTQKKMAEMKKRARQIKRNHGAMSPRELKALKKEFNRLSEIKSAVVNKLLDMGSANVTLRICINDNCKVDDKQGGVPQGNDHVKDTGSYLDDLPTETEEYNQESGEDVTGGDTPRYIRFNIETGSGKGELPQFNNQCVASAFRAYMDRVCGDLFSETDMQLKVERLNIKMNGLADDFKRYQKQKKYGDARLVKKRWNTLNQQFSKGLNGIETNKGYHANCRKAAVQKAKMQCNKKSGQDHTGLPDGANDSIAGEQVTGKINASYFQCTFDGEWDSYLGNISLRQSGSSVQGVAAYESTKIEGKVSGEVMTGYWSKPPDYKIHGTKGGDMILTLSDDCASYSGKWRHGTEEAGDDFYGWVKWPAKRKKSDPPTENQTGSAGENKKSISPKKLLEERLKKINSSNDKLKNLRQQWDTAMSQIKKRRDKGEDVTDLKQNLMHIRVQQQQIKERLEKLNAQ